MKQAGCTKVAVANDKEAYGAGLATLLGLEKGFYGVTITSNTGIDPTAPNFRSYASTIQGQGADCFFFSGIVSNGAVQLTKDVHAALPKAKIFVPDGACTGSYTNPKKGGVPAGDRSADPVHGGHAGPARLSRRQGLPGRVQGQVRRGTPDPYAIYGYEAMKLGLDTIGKLGAQGTARRPCSRRCSRPRAAARCSARYGFDANGDTTLKSYGLYKVDSSRQPGVLQDDHADQDGPLGLERMTAR